MNFPGLAAFGLRIALLNTHQKRIVRSVLVALCISIVTQGLFAQTFVLTAPNGGEYWTVGSTPRISWRSDTVGTLSIALTTDGGITWTKIAGSVPAKNKTFAAWTISDTITSSDCLIRIIDERDTTRGAVSAQPFIINTDPATFTLVVLGSSTAAGAGPSVKDSAWVWRYRNYFQERNTTINVVNLAVGGYTTYDIMPSDFIPPQGRRETKAGKNLTAAFTYRPDAIVINLPSNDVNLGYSVEEQLTNFDSILSRTRKRKVPVWITTTQPRNFSEEKRGMQFAVRDSIFRRYRKFAVDFWNGIADSAGMINPLFNSGDGIHVNDRAHELFFRRMLQAGICNSIVTAVPRRVLAQGRMFAALPASPALFSTSRFSYMLDVPEHIRLSVIDDLGRSVLTLLDEVRPAGAYEVDLEATDLEEGLYLLRLEQGGEIRTEKVLLLR